MAKNYKEVPTWWYLIVLVGSFVLGIAVVAKENLTLQVWGYVVALVVGIIIAPFVSPSPSPSADILCITMLTRVSEYYSLCSLWQWYCHQ